MALLLLYPNCFFSSFLNNFFLNIKFQFCNDGADTYMCATVECSVNMVNPTDLDSRRFVLSFDMLLNDLPKLEKVSYCDNFISSKNTNQKLLKVFD